MAKEFFKDLPDTSTPLSATRINGLLDGEESMGSIVVEDIKSKNLFDKNKVLFNAELVAATGATKSNSTYFVSDFMDVKGLSNVYLSSTGKTAGSSNCFYDENKQFIKNIPAITGKIPVPENSVYMRFNCLISEIDNDIQVEAGTIRTNYNKHINFDNDIVQVTDFITANNGYTLMEQNIFRQGNHYFGDVVIKKNAGAFSADSENVATLKKNIVGTINSCAFLCGSQWANGGTGYLFIGGTSIIISDFTGNSYSFAKFHIDVVAN